MVRLWEIGVDRTTNLSQWQLLEFNKEIFAAPRMHGRRPRRIRKPKTAGFAGRGETINLAWWRILGQLKLLVSSPDRAENKPPELPGFFSFWTLPHTADADSAAPGETYIKYITLTTSAAHFLHRGPSHIMNTKMTASSQGHRSLGKPGTPLNQLYSVGD